MDLNAVKDLKQKRSFDVKQKKYDAYVVVHRKLKFYRWETVSAGCKRLCIINVVR